MGQYYKPISIEKKQYVYSHDYGNGLKLMEHSWLSNGFVGVVEDLIAEGGAWNGDRIVWAGDYADEEKNRKSNLFSLTEPEKCRIRPEPTENKYRYVINMDTKEYVDKTKIPVSDVYTEDDGKEWPYVIHPLPILTCEGNGRGGGDLHKESDLVGKWARNRVTVANEIPEGFTEMEFQLYEGTEPVVLKEETTVDF
jgi:hypothetical protein